MMTNPVFWLLVVLALLALFTFIERFVNLRHAQIDCSDFLNGVINVLDRGNADEALSICDDTPAPVSEIVATAIRHRADSARLLREAVDARGRAVINRLDRRLATLAIIGQIAPLLGLLGAIIGFVRTVHLANAAVVVTRSELIGGSMEALVMAAMGLAVAIPIVVMYGSLRVRLDSIVAELEASASQIIGYISTQREKEKAK